MRLRRAKLQAFHSLLAILSLFATYSAQAATIHVPADQPTIQAGINAAAPGDTVLVAPGTYYENINFNGKAIIVTSSGGAANTIIDGGAKAPVVIFSAGETRASVLSNLTLRNGGVSGSTWGGIVSYSSPTILNNLIVQNACNGYSGNGNALLQGNTISGTFFSSGLNCNNSYGAAILLTGSNPANIIGNVIENNVQPTPFNSAAIVLFTTANAVIENNIIRNNAMTGIRVYNTNSLLFVQNLVYGNNSQDGGGAMTILVPFGLPGPVTEVIANNTFIANTANPNPPNTASQVMLDGNLSQLDFVNNIVVGGTSDAAFQCGYPPADANSLTPIVIDHNDIYNANGPAYGTGCPDHTGTYGNISANPLFNNPAGADFHLKPGSPAIDAGNTSVHSLLAEDFDGNPRLQDATGKLYPIVDMGAYELQSLADANATTIILTPSSYQVAGGASITLTAKLLSANGVPTGTVTFNEDNATIGSSLIDATGTAAFSTVGLTPGIHSFVATYPGQSAFTPATAVHIFALVGAYLPGLTLTSTPNPSTQGQPVTFTAVISPFATPIVLTGTTTSTTLATLAPNSSGVATFTTSALTGGTHIITAQYPGDTYHAPVSASITQQVLSPTSTTLSINPTQSKAFQFFNVTVSVTSLTNVPFTLQCSPACTITLNITSLPNNQNSTVSAPILNGTAIFRYALAVGTYTFTATFNGSSTFASSTSTTVSQIVDPAPTTLTLSASPNPATQTQSVAFTSVLTAPLSVEAPGGTITFFDGSTPFASAPFSANVLGNTITATASTTTLAPGTHTITASYPGNVNFLPVTSPPVNLTINPSDFTLTVEPSIITIQAEHHATTPVTLTSLGSLTGQVSLSCSNLPIWTTCTFDPNVRQLTSGSTATASLYLDTDAVIGYARNTPATPKPGTRTTTPITLALLLPAALLFTLRRKLRIPARLVLLALTTLAAALTISGCSGLYPPHTPPGVYNITITGTGPGGLVHTANITLNVTP